jgi:hypothetical protein
MKNKGQIGSLGISIVVAIMLFMVGMMAMNFIKGEVTNSRVASGLDCSNPSISDGTKLTCLAVDLVVPYLILTIIAAVGGLVIARIIL